MYYLALLVFLYAIHGSRSVRLFELPFERHIATIIWLPQGWSFFTRDPREPWPRAFSRHPDGSWSNASLGTLSTARNAFGLNRRPRAQGVEISLLLQQVPGKEWSSCSVAPITCLETISNASYVVNLSPQPSLCGVIGIALQEPVPWAWSHHTDRTILMPSKVVRLFVSC
jgi:antimicrobial peptide system SdpA family protein